MQGTWRTRGLRGGLRRSLQATALMSLLAGCSIADDMFGGSAEPTSTPQPVPGPGANSTPQTTPAPAQNQAYPNLGSVPAQAPTTSTSAQRQQVASGLVADNQNAAYSQQPVTPQPADQGSAAVPPPAPAPVAAPTTTDTTATATQTTTASAEPAPAATTPMMSTDTGSTTGVTTTNTTPAATAEPTMAETAPAPMAPAPAAPAMAQPVTPPATTEGVTPLAPPPNPIPPASQTASTTYDNGSVSVDTSQIGGGPLPGTAPPLPYYATNTGAIAGSGQPVAVIFFADASTALSERDLTVLHDVYLIQQQQGGHLRIVGNASMRTATLDPSQHDQVNYQYSQKRANAVARALINMGVPDGSIGVTAQGSQQPVFYEFMPSGEAGNRRVEIYLDR